MYQQGTILENWQVWVVQNLCSKTQIKSLNSVLHAHYPVAHVMIKLHVWSEVYDHQGCSD